MTLGNPDFLEYATAFYIEGRRVAIKDASAPRLKAPLVGGCVDLIVVPVDDTEKLRVLIDELRAHTAKSGGE